MTNGGKIIGYSDIGGFERAPRDDDELASVPDWNLKSDEEKQELRDAVAVYHAAEADPTLHERMTMPPVSDKASDADGHWMPHVSVDHDNDGRLRAEIKRQERYQALKVAWENADQADRDEWLRVKNYRAQPDDLPNRRAQWERVARPRESLLYRPAIDEMLQVLEYGAQKYGDHDYQDECRERPAVEHFDALSRHMAAWSRGEILDPDSRCQHLAHAMCRLMMMIYLVDHDEID